MDEWTDGRTLCFTEVTPFSEKYGVAVAWGVVDGSKGGVPVRMLNPNDRTIKLVKGTLITQLEECDVLNTDLLSASNAIDAPSQTTLLIAISVSTSCPTLEDVHTEVSFLSVGQREQLRKLLRDFQDVFGKDGDKPGRTSEVEHRIDLEDGSLPFKLPQRRVPLQTRRSIDKPRQC